jgi:hypothetical protein
MTALQDYTRLKRRSTGDEPQELAWGLVLDSLVFTAEAEIRWLDHCEARLRRAALERAASVPVGSVERGLDSARPPKASAR